AGKNSNLLPIVLYPDPILNKKAREVTLEELRAGKADNLDLNELVMRMVATMYDAEGIGLAAPQVGVGLRLFVADVSPERNTPFSVFNPVLKDPNGSIEEEEGCLSIPKVRAKVKRAESLILSGLDPQGQPLNLPVEGLPARVCQHETDHLDGVLFIQRIGTAARFMLRQKLRELEEDY